MYARILQSIEASPHQPSSLAFSSEELTALCQGVLMHGAGQWSAIRREFGLDFGMARWTEDRLCNEWIKLKERLNGDRENMALGCENV